MSVVGFCNNDKDDEVYLKVEAYAIGDDDTKKVGEARVDIYPQTDPKKKSELNVSANEDEKILSTEDVSFVNVNCRKMKC